MEIHLSEFGVEAVVNEGVVGGMRHGQPMANECDVVDFLPLNNFRIAVT